MTTKTIHAAPWPNETLTPCCGRRSEDLPQGDRMVTDPALVTCQPQREPDPDEGTMPAPRLFVLHRDTDVSGVSGTGEIADGACWPDGTVSIRWRGARPSIVFRNSMDDVEAIEGHDGATRIIWTDGASVTAPEPDAPEAVTTGQLRTAADRILDAAAGLPEDAIGTHRRAAQLLVTAAALLDAIAAQAVQ